MPAAVAAVALVALYGLAMAGHPVTASAGQPAAAARAIPVTAVQRGCPGLGLTGGSSGQVAFVAAASPGGSGGQALATALSAAAGRHPLLSASQPGQLSLGPVRPAGGAVPAALRGANPAGGQAAGQASGTRAVASVPLRGGVMVQASGTMARGLEVEQTSAAGTPTAACSSPGTDFWFVGPGQHSAARIQLYLMNPSDQAADVSVEIATDAGPLQGSTDTGIAVAPHSMVAQSLAPVLHGSRVVSLHVRTSVGQVVASVLESTGTTGGSWLPIAQLPSTRVIVPGLPATTGTRQLFVAVPGMHDAHLTIAAVTSRGSYEPTGGGGVDVPGGSAIAIPLPSMGGIAAALKLTSTQPVTAALLVPGGPAGAPGVFTAAAPPLQEQGVVAANTAASALILSAPKGQATVRVTELGGGSAPPAKTVQIGAGHSKLVQLTAIHGVHTFPVVVTPLPGSGPVYAGRVTVSAGAGTVQALMPVASALTQVPLPAVRAAPITARP
ncbi:MAG: DUF5719 family protein [Gemmatimonadota bacterium]